MKIETFRMERWQSLYENTVEINLSDSGVHPLSLAELGDEELVDDVRRLPLRYIQTDGSPVLRESVAGLYPGATPRHVEITNGGAEANFVVAWTLLEPDDEVVVMMPNYMQIRGIARSVGARVREWWLRPDADSGRWRAAATELEECVTPRTRLIAICNPNNPTGSRLEAAQLDAICEIAARHGSWILSDEVYQGSERDGAATPSLWGRYERTIITNSLSKSYGLPGLRLGWIVAPPAERDALWSAHDYTTIAPCAISDRVAQWALQTDHRERLFARSRGIIRENHARVAAWIDAHETLHHFPPEAGAIIFVRYDAPISSLELAERWRQERSVLVVPGEHFEQDGWFRLGLGEPAGPLAEGLSRLSDTLRKL